MLGLEIEHCPLAEQITCWTLHDLIYHSVLALSSLLLCSLSQSSLWLRMCQTFLQASGLVSFLSRQFLINCTWWQVTTALAVQNCNKVWQSPPTMSHGVSQCLMFFGVDSFNLKILTFVLLKANCNKNNPCYASYNNSGLSLSSER